jgi:hypothetical protein
MPMEISMKAIGTMTKLMVMDSICMQTVQHTQGIGSKTNKREEE